MSLEDLIAAERSEPPAPSEKEAKSVWKRVRAGAGAAVPPAFDISPMATTVTLKTKISAFIASTTGKIVLATTLAAGGVGGAAAIAPDQGDEDGHSTVVARGDAREGPPAPEPVPAGKTHQAQAPAAAAPTVDANVNVDMDANVDVDMDVDANVDIDANADATVDTAPSIDHRAPPRDTRSAERRRRPSKSDPQAAEPPTSTFSDEVDLIRKAQTALAGGRAKAALSTLAEHARRFPKGSMTEDRLALRALALCSSGRAEQGRREAARFTKRFPRSLYADRVNVACSH